MSDGSTTRPTRTRAPVAHFALPVGGRKSSALDSAVSGDAGGSDMVGPDDESGAVSGAVSGASASGRRADRSRDRFDVDAAASRGVLDLLIGCEIRRLPVRLRESGADWCQGQLDRAEMHGGAYRIHAQYAGADSGEWFDLRELQELMGTQTVSRCSLALLAAPGGEPLSSSDLSEMHAACVRWIRRPCPVEAAEEEGGGRRGSFMYIGVTAATRCAQQASDLDVLQQFGGCIIEREFIMEKPSENQWFNGIIERVKYRRGFASIFVHYPGISRPRLSACGLSVSACVYPG